MSMSAGAAWLIFGGLFKKVVISSYLATHDRGSGVRRSRVATARSTCCSRSWGYAIVIYADFSGYTDIAIGIAKLLGFQFPQNFDRPYSARSLQDFWRRWHMTLSRWLRDYLYIPLGGSKKGEMRTYVNIMVTMVLGGLWHGAAWTFVFWGCITASARRSARGSGRTCPNAPRRPCCCWVSGSARSPWCAWAGSSSAPIPWRPRSRCWDA